MAKNRRINELTQDDYINAIDIFRKYRTINSIQSALRISPQVAKRLIEVGYSRKGWHALRLVVEEENVLKQLHKDDSDREKARRRYKQMTEYYESANIASMMDENKKVDLSKKPMLKVMELKTLWELKKEILDDEVDEKGYASPFQTWSDKELVDFVTGKRRPK